MTIGHSMVRRCRELPVCVRRRCFAFAQRHAAGGETFPIFWPHPCCSWHARSKSLSTAVIQRVPSLCCVMQCQPFPSYVHFHDDWLTDRACNVNVDHHEERFIAMVTSSPDEHATMSGAISESLKALQLARPSWAAVLVD